MNDINSWRMATWNIEVTLMELVKTAAMLAKDRLLRLYSAFQAINAATQDLLFEDAESVVEHIHRYSLSAVIKCSLAWFVLEYACTESRPGLPVRLLFVLFSLYMLIKLWYLPRISLSTLHYASYAELFVFSVTNCVCRSDQPVSCFILNAGLSLVVALTTSRGSLSILMGLPVCLLNSAILYWEGTRFIVILEPLVFHFIIVVLLNIWHRGMLEAIRTLIQTKNNTLHEINTTMFVASIAHDLKNPLSSILGCIDQLKTSSNINAAEKRNLLAASYSVQILFYLIGNIHDVSKLACGKFEIDSVPMSIGKEVSKVIHIEKELAIPKGLKFYKKIVRPLPACVYGDPMRFEQVLINLLGNAIKFTSKGYVAIVLNWVSSIDEIEEDSDIIPSEDYFLTQRRPHTTKGEDSHSIDFRSHSRNASSDDDLLAQRDTVECTSTTVMEQMLKYTKIAHHTKHNTEGNGMRAIHTEVNEIHAFREDPPRTLVSANQMFTFDAHRTLGAPRAGDDERGSCAEEERECDEEDEQEEELPEAGTLERDSGLLVVDIIDTGIGIGKDGQAKLFQPFSQANKGIRRQYGGTGLGLWITKQLVSSMSGVVKVRSESKRGSAFRVTIPFTVCMSEDTPEEMKLGRTRVTASWPCPVTEIRQRARHTFKGSNNQLKSMRMLLIEDSKSQHDRKLEQLFSLLSIDRCDVMLATYENAPSILEQEGYRFDALFVIACTPTLVAKTGISRVLKFLLDHDIKPIPFCVATGKCAGRTVE